MDRTGIYWDSEASRDWLLRMEDSAIWINSMDNITRTVWTCQVDGTGYLEKGFIFRLVSIKRDVNEGTSPHRVHGML